MYDVIPPLPGKWNPAYTHLIIECYGADQQYISTLWKGRGNVMCYYVSFPYWIVKFMLNQTTPHFFLGPKHSVKIELTMYFFKG